MDNNNLTLIKNGIFSRLHKLSLIDLSRNRIEIIENNSFVDLFKLVDLNFSENPLLTEWPLVKLYDFKLDKFIEMIQTNEVMRQINSEEAKKQHKARCFLEIILSLMK